MSFLGNATSYLKIPTTSEFDFGTGDFTIEWYQYQTDSNPYPRIFQVGTYTSESLSIGVSIEGGNFYYWTNNTPNFAFYLSPSNYKNQWVHFAISRSRGVTKIFKNGVSLFSMSDSTHFSNGGNDLVIANETTPSNDTAFGGYITYFTWVKGVALYTSNFTVSNTYPTLTSDYVLLLKATSFDGTLGSTVINNNVTNVENVPPGFSATGVPSRPAIKFIKPLFTDNARVYYKPGSLASCGVGTVRNSSVKSRRI